MSVPRQARWVLSYALGAFAFIGVTPSAIAAELVVLRSGFTLVCEKRESITNDRVRLYLAADHTRPEASGNYVEMPAAAIAGVEQLALAPVSPAVSPAPGAQPSASVADLLQQSGAGHNISVALLAAVVQAESAGNPLAVSRAGARGLMQLMPATAASIGVADSSSPAANVDGGSAYLDLLLRRYHEDILLALAAYNAGPAAVDRYHGVPPFRETRQYVARVIRNFNHLAQVQAAAVQQQGSPGAGR